MVKIKKEKKIKNNSCIPQSSLELANCFC